MYIAGYLIYTPHPIHACMHTCIHEHIATHFTYAHMHIYINLINAYIPTSYTTHTYIYIYVNKHTLYIHNVWPLHTSHFRHMHTQAHLVHIYVHTSPLHAHTHTTSFPQLHPHHVSVPDSRRAQTVTPRVLWCFIGRKPLSFLSVFQGSAPRAHTRA